MVMTWESCGLLADMRGRPGRRAKDLVPVAWCACFLAKEVFRFSIIVECSGRPAFFGATVDFG
jgi:hypothetical protein